MYQQQKKVTADGSMGSKSELKYYESLQKHQTGSGTKKNKKGKRSGYNK
ncbi:hypothetical protein ACH3O9_14380 [Leeuwenhoekiella sp. A16]|tara:strand:+ start:99 stop:245 length:147 start_codon:yes stop_codon:yes gene_type:complete